LSCKDKERNGHVDLESLENYIRSSMHKIGSIMLEKLLNADGGDYRGVSIPCENGHTYDFVEYRNKDVMTVLGEIKVSRVYYYDKECRIGTCPKDKAFRHRWDILQSRCQKNYGKSWSIQVIWSWA